MTIARRALANLIEFLRIFIGHQVGRKSQFYISRSEEEMCELFSSFESSKRFNGPSDPVKERGRG